MYKKCFLFSFIILLVILVVSAVSGWAEEGEGKISGRISTGYRVLDIEPNKDNRLKVYRGDYIKFSYSKNFASLALSMPELKYTEMVFPEPAKSPFFKMKTVGNYSFSLGEWGGTITVIDLVRPNYTEVTADEAVELLDNLHPFVLDVRTHMEYRKIHLEESYLIPIQQLQARLDELESKKHEDIFVYCATGNRSTVAAKILADHGFKRIYNLRYGVYDWARRGHPYKTGD